MLPYSAGDFLGKTFFSAPLPKDIFKMCLRFESLWKYFTSDVERGLYVYNARTLVKLCEEAVLMYA